MRTVIKLSVSCFLAPTFIAFISLTQLPRWRRMRHVGRVCRRNESTLQNLAHGGRGRRTPLVARAAAAAVVVVVGQCSRRHRRDCRRRHPGAIAGAARRARASRCAPMSSRAIARHCGRTARTGVLRSTHRAHIKCILVSTRRTPVLSRSRIVARQYCRSTARIGFLRSTHRRAHIKCILFSLDAHRSCCLVQSRGIAAAPLGSGICALAVLI